MARASDTLAPSPRVDDVAEAVPHQVHGQRKQSDDGSRHDDRPPIAQGSQVQPDVRDDPEFGDEGIAREEADERERRKDQDDRPHIEGDLDEDGREDVRQDMPEHDLEASGPRGPCALNERRLLRGQGQAPTIPGVQRPPDDNQGEGHVEEGPADYESNGEGENEKGNGEEDVRDPHHGFVEPFAGVARNDSDQRSDRRTDEDDEEGNRDVDPDRFHHQLQQVETADPREPILDRPKQVADRWRLRSRADALRICLRELRRHDVVRILYSEDIRVDLNDEGVTNEQQEDHEARDGGLVGAEHPRREFQLVEPDVSLGDRDRRHRVSLVADSWIQERVQDVQDQRRGDEDESEDEGRTHHHADVAVQERDRRPPADALESEDVLDDDGAAEQTGHEISVRRHGRKQCVLLRVKVVDQPLRDTLRSRQADIVLLEHLEHRSAKDPDDAGQQGESESEGGQDHVEERVPRNGPVAMEEGVDRKDVRRIGDGGRVIEPRVRNRREQDGIDVALVRKEAPSGPEREEDREADQEDRHRVQGKGHDADALVEDGIAACGGIHADRDRDYPRQERGDDRQHDRVRHEPDEARRHRLPERRRGAHVSLKNRREPIEGLDVEGIVQVKLGRELLDQLLSSGPRQMRIDVLCKEQGRHADMLKGEDEKRQPDNRRNEKDEPQNNIDPELHTGRSEKRGLGG